MASSPSHRALASATRPLHLAPLAIGALTGGGLLAVGLAPLALAAGAVSLTTWGALVAWDLAAPPPPLTPFARLLASVHRAAEPVTARIGSQDGGLGAALAEVRSRVNALVEQANALAARGESVDRFLEAHPAGDLEREIREQKAALGRIRDPEAAATLRAALEAKERQRAVITELRADRERLIAGLVSAEAALDELHARLVRLTLNDPTDEIPRDAAAEIRELGDRVGILERSAAQTLRELDALGEQEVG